MRNELLDCIDPVIRRLRRLRFWQSIGWLAWALVAIVGTWMLLNRGADTMPSWIAIVSTLFVAALACWVGAVWKVRGTQSIARRIERRFPDLDQRLITAMDDSLATQSDGYLKQRVMREARDHARRNPWSDVVSPRWMWVNRIFGLSGTIATLGLATFVMLAKPNVIATASSVAPLQPNVTIVPGNTEIERGTNLLVTAQFASDWIGRQTAVDPELVILPIDAETGKEADAAQMRLPMRRSMADPIWGGLASEVDRSFRYRVELPFWSSDEYEVRVFEYPAVTRSDAELIYPDFTGLQPRRIEDTVRVSAAEGSTITWWIRVNKPIASAKLHAKPGKDESPSTPIDFAPAGGQPEWWTASMEVRQTGRYEVRLLDADGRENQSPTDLSVRMLPNQSAKIKLTAGGDLTVSALEEISVAAEVRDDHGIARAGISLTFADQPAMDVVLATDIESNKKTTIEHLIDMESFGAKPDQLLAYSFWAEDAVAGETDARRTQSDLYFAEVRRFEEIFREGQPQSGEPAPPSEQEQQAEELAELQKQIIQATWKLSQSITRFNDQTRADVGVIAEAQQDVITQLDELSQQLNDADSKKHAVDAEAAMQTAITELNQAIQSDDRQPLSAALAAEQAAYAGLLRLRASEFQVTKSKSQPSQGSAGQQNKQKQLDELELKQDEDRYETQQQAQETPQQQAQRETRQVLSRLAELARRQQDLNEELAQIQSALQLEEDEAKQEELRRQLERLREQQQDILRQTDELSERMNSPENSEAMSEASEQLEETRENLREAAEAMQQQDPSAALASGKRAERELESVREDIREQTAGQFNDAMQSMRDDARQLDEKQNELESQLAQIDQPGEGAGLRADGDRGELEKSLQEQREALAELLQQVEDTVQEAEESEPLLAQTLYDTFRETQQRRTEERLDGASQLLERGFDAQAQQMAEQAGDAIENLREEIDAAAESVLGNEAEALQRAADLAEQLQNAVEQEMQAAQPNNNAAGQSEPSDAEPSEEQSGKGQPSQGQPSEKGQPAEGSQPGEGQAPGEGQPSENEQPGQGNQPGDGQQPGPPGLRGQGSTPGQTPGQSPSENESQNPTRAGGSNPSAAQSPNAAGNVASPLFGEGFREWSDGLRDIEQMVNDPELSSQATRIRERAREMRDEFRRNSKTPQFDLVEEMIVEPMRELKRDLSEEFMRRSAKKQSLVPIDRDPVPDQFSDAVQRYYERIGSGL